ncbi:hypothetical protein PSI23_18060 [Xenorhabdus sp. XENO-10]|uniref:Uncharacterized protein n=1 Tax=Xenorhabdus yunnanensis TaxID=3025878 RepID=A0ABT5LJ61_9GAMM|nr:hypothetical protein [Xenorhabdus yunnanensis]MDC9591139.1 hypothetical protein [Xenorhabdus yunnanensis]
MEIQKRTIEAMMGGLDLPEFWIAAALIGLIPAALANSKGRNFFAWWVYGTLLFIVALIHAFVLDKADKKK